MTNYPRLAYDGYHTIDGLAVDTLVKGFPVAGRRVWEPCAGIGYLVRQLEAHGAEVVATELHAYPDQDPRITIGVDFLRARRPLAPVIVTNPPYRQASEFVSYALHLLPEGHVVMLLRHDWICRKGEIFAERLRGCAPIRGRLRWIEGEAKNSPRHNFAWLIYGPCGQPDAPRLVL